MKIKCLLLLKVIEMNIYWHLFSIFPLFLCLTLNQEKKTSSSDQTNGLSNKDQTIRLVYSYACRRADTVNESKIGLAHKLWWITKSHPLNDFAKCLKFESNDFSKNNSHEMKKWFAVFEKFYAELDFNKIPNWYGFNAYN